MKQNQVKTSGSKGLVRHAPVSRKKVFVAVALLLVMGFMWTRGLLKNRTSDAVAGGTGTDGQAISMAGVGSDSDTVTYVHLEVIKGRHDSIARPLFSTANWSTFPGKVSQKLPEKLPVSHDLSAVARQVSESLKVDVIMGGQEAFIEGELVKKGATLKVKRGEQVVSFLVKSIDVNKVILAWVSTESESFEFEVKMSEMHEDK